MIWDVPPALGGLVSRLGFRPTKKQPKNWWRVFDGAERDSAEEVRLKLIAANLKGSWQQVPEPVRAKRRPKRSKPGTAPQQPSAQIITLQTAKELRLAQDALKIAQEKRRQAEKAAVAEVNRRAKDAVRRVNQDRPGDHSRRREPPAP